MSTELPTTIGAAASKRKVSVAKDHPPPYSYPTIVGAAAIHGPSSVAPIQRAPCRPPQSSSLQRPQKRIQGLQWYGPAAAERLTKSQCSTQQLRRYLLEIIALTVDADFDALNCALYRDTDIKNANSILAPSERSDLLDLSRLAARGSKIVKAGHALHQLDIQDLQKRYVGPAESIQGLVYFAVDYIAWYSNPLPYSVPWQESIPGLFQQNDDTFPPWMEYPPSGPESWQIDSKPAESMRSLRTATNDYAPDHGVKAVLMKAHNECYERYGYGRRDDARAGAVTYWPTRKEFEKLSYVLEDGLKASTRDCHTLRQCRERGCKLRITPYWRLSCLLEGMDSRGVNIEYRIHHQSNSRPANVLPFCTTTAHTSNA